jgi:hypothetical protein
LPRSLTEVVSERIVRNKQRSGGAPGRLLFSSA